MNPKEIERIIKALENIDQSLKKFVDEGITIYSHQDGDEELN